MNKDRIRTFDELSDEEADEAIGKLFREVSDDYETGKIDVIYPADNLRTEETLQDTLWDFAGALAREAVYIPDDGSKVVRL